MPDAAVLAPLRPRFGDIDARLREAETEGSFHAGERDAMKADIIALYKQAEQEIAQLSAFRDEIKALIERWKGLQEASNGEASNGSVAPRFSTARPTAQADHLGASTFLEKGWNLISLGDHDGAEKALLRALELSPDDPQAESLLGWAQMLQEKYDDALLNFQKVLMRQPANSLARINVGYICLKKRIFGEAIEHLSRAIRLDNDRKAVLYAHFYLGLVYLEREMYEDAQTFFRKTIALGPNLIEAYYELGRALWFDGRKDDALEAWRDGFKANKFNPWGKRCADMLDHVKGGGVPARAS